MNPAPLARIAPIVLVALLASCGGGEADPQPTPNSNNGGNGEVIERPADGSTNQPDTDVSGLPGTAQSFIDEALNEVNSARRSQQQCGEQAMPPQALVRWDARIEQSARDHSIWMQQTNTFSHTGIDDSNTGDRLTAAGYNWYVVTENIAAGYASLPAVVEAWLDSVSHCEAIMNGSVTEMAVWKVDGTSANEFNNYWTLVLAVER